MKSCIIGPVFLIALAGSSAAAKPPAPPPTTESVRDAIERALPLIEKGSAGSADQRQCFTCHNQAVPILALAKARRRGFRVDEENFQRQVRHTYDHLRRGKQNYLEGKGQGGRAITAGYALWALEAGQWEPEEVTAAVTQYLLAYQKDKGRWSHPGNRPPSSGSDFTTSYVALRGLSAYGTAEQIEAIEQRSEQLKQWLERATAQDTEDRVFRLWSWAYLTKDPARTEQARTEQAAQELLELQNEDGGWSQTTEMKSDAYATATTLVALAQAGSIPPEHFAYQQGVAYLLESQQADGSWYVKSRADPFQTYFESGFPHQEDQFISIAASSWATLALLLMLPEPPAPPCP